VKLLNIENSISLEQLLSSRTYKTRGFNECVYCGKSVESDYYEYEQGEFCQPYRCDCTYAKEELVAKERLYERLIELDACIDKEEVNKKSKDYEIYIVNRKYEEEIEILNDYYMISRYPDDIEEKVTNDEAKKVYDYTKLIGEFVKLKIGE
jgi:hypothetical protein